ncbi:MAG: HAMP domain-containing histidine kinase [Cyanobacteria bacterium P01_A01_bin.68]
MFRKTRYQLTVAYIGVLTVILMVFAFAVRFTFVNTLESQFNNRLKNLAKAAAFNMDSELGGLDVDEEEILIGKQQAIEWFDAQGKLIAKQGKYRLKLPVNTIKSTQTQIQTQKKLSPIRGFTRPVINVKDEKIIGYVRVSESLTDLNSTIRTLDLGLSSGVVVALILSGFGGIWLTNRAMKPIEESFVRLKQFTADASHELRSPLMAIKTNASVALKYPEGIREKDEEKFNSIASATNQMTRLTEDLLLLARTDKVSAIHQKSVHLSLILSDLIQLYEPIVREKDILLTAKLNEDLYFSGDEALLKQVFTNLIQNAIHYTSTGGLVTVEATKINSKIFINVKDTGIGIAPENIDKIFERFFRVDKSRSYQTGNSGLGLAIVREIVQLHKGTISVESELGVGSCFTIRFPGKDFLSC